MNVILQQAKELANGLGTKVVDCIISDKYHNGTGYLDSLTRESLDSSVIHYGEDSFGRGVMAVPYSLLGGIDNYGINNLVLFQRYPDDDMVFVTNGEVPLYRHDESYHNLHITSNVNLEAVVEKLISTANDSLAALS